MAEDEFCEAAPASQARWARHRWHRKQGQEKDRGGECIASHPAVVL